MQVKRCDIKGNRISREEIHKKISENTVCNEIINNTILAIKKANYEKR